jgi:hypothetical protein
MQKPILTPSPLIRTLIGQAARYAMSNTPAPQRFEIGIGSLGLNWTHTPERERPLPVETVLSRDAMMQAIVAMLAKEPELSGAEIARRLGQQGYRAANGAELSGANVLRDFRRWTVDQDAKN